MTWTKVNKPTGQAWTKVGKPAGSVISLAPAGRATGLLTPPTYSYPSSIVSLGYTKISKPTGQAWIKINKPT